MKRPFDAVIFDMDGTLVEKMLDFQAIRAELGIRPEEGILEAIERMGPAEGARAGKILLERELAAAREARLMPGAEEIVQKIRNAGLKLALLTRNARQAMEMVLEKFSREGLQGRPIFELAWSRQDGPVKPDPESILRPCRRLGVQPERTCCVGDFYYDVVAANAAGAVSVLLRGENDSQFAHQADYVIGQLDELEPILEI